MLQIICNAPRDDGEYCDGIAAVTSARFVYQHELIDGRDEQVLCEVVYAVDCPKCGKHTIIDRADCDKMPSAEIQAARAQFASGIPAEKSRLMRSSGEGAFFVQMDSGSKRSNARSTK